MARIREHVEQPARLRSRARLNSRAPTSARARASPPICGGTAQPIVARCATCRHRWPYCHCGCMSLNTPEGVESTRVLVGLLIATARRRSRAKHASPLPPHRNRTATAREETRTAFCRSLSWPAERPCCQCLDGSLRSRHGAAGDLCFALVASFRQIDQFTTPATNAIAPTLKAPHFSCQLRGSVRGKSAVAVPVGEGERVRWPRGTDDGYISPSHAGRPTRLTFRRAGRAWSTSR